MPFNNADDMKAFLRPSIFSCGLCGDVFRVDSDLKKHIDTHSIRKEGAKRPEKSEKPIKELENMLEDTLR